MKLLFDAGFSPRLVDRLADTFRGSMHVERGLEPGRIGRWCRWPG
jgi:predicted nuclease of predicted toxin-antitoxin system